MVERLEGRLRGRLGWGLVGGLDFQMNFANVTLVSDDDKVGMGLGWWMGVSDKIRQCNIGQ